MYRKHEATAVAWSYNRLLEPKRVTFGQNCTQNTQQNGDSSLAVAFAEDVHRSVHFVDNYKFELTTTERDAYWYSDAQLKAIAQEANREKRRNILRKRGRPSVRNAMLHKKGSKEESILDRETKENTLRNGKTRRIFPLSVLSIESCWRSPNIQSPTTTNRNRLAAPFHRRHALILVGER